MKKAIPLGALVAALALPAPASALIQLNRGIAGARLGNTTAEVRAALGNPAGVRHGQNVFGPFTRYRYAGGITVFFQGRENVSSVSTRGLGDRTTGGVGVGSSERTLRRRVRGERCETSGGSRLCYTGSLRPGGRNTTFFIRRGRVSRVTVARVVD